MKKRLKGLLSLWLAAALALSMLAVPAAAAWSQSDHADPSDSSKHEGTDLNSSGVTSLTGGDYYLSGEFGSDITITGGTVNLCLNGRQFSGTITVNQGAKLTITDCSAKKTGDVLGTIKNNGAIEYDTVISLAGYSGSGTIQYTPSPSCPTKIAENVPDSVNIGLNYSNYITQTGTANADGSHTVYVVATDTSIHSATGSEEHKLEYYQSVGSINDQAHLIEETGAYGFTDPITLFRHDPNYYIADDTTVYVFDGWWAINRYKNSKQLIDKDTETTTVFELFDAWGAGCASGKITLAAEWKPGVTVTYQYEDNATADKTVGVAFTGKDGNNNGIVFGYAAEAPVSRRGYTFQGWLYSGSTYQTGAALPSFGGNITLTAQWSANSGGGGGPTYYAITVEETEHGAVTSNYTRAPSGRTVTLTATPEEHYALSALTVTDSRGGEVKLTDQGGGIYTFNMPSRSVTVTAAFESARWNQGYRDCPRDHTCPIWPFTDAETTAWYHDGVHFCLENELMVGYGNNIFKPDSSTTRAMIAVMLWRLSGSPVVNYALDFDDVEEDTWYTEAIRWAVSEEVAVGYGNGCFGPDDDMTREQMVTILWRYAQRKGYDVSVGEDTNILSYNDAFDVSEYAIPAMQWACGSGMVVGKDDPNGGMILEPKGSTTRAQMATVMMHFCEMDH